MVYSAHRVTKGWSKMLLNEKYGISPKTARQFAIILSVTRDHRMDYDCGPSPQLTARCMGATTAYTRTRIKEMEGMGLVRNYRSSNGRVIPGSSNVTLQGSAYLREWERHNESFDFALD